MVRKHSSLLYAVTACQSFVVNFKTAALIFSNDALRSTVTCSDVSEFYFRMTGFKSQHAVLKVKVKLSLCTSRKHTDEWRCISTHPSPQRYMEVSRFASCPGQKGIGWTPELISRFWRKEKFLFKPGVRTLHPRCPA
jgi:hypothetical protein